MSDDAVPHDIAGGIQRWVAARASERPENAPPESLVPDQDPPEPQWAG